MTKPNNACIKKRINCRNCSNVWHPTDKNTMQLCPICGKRTDVRDRSEYTKEYLINHPERKNKMKDWRSLHGKDYERRQRVYARKRVLVMISHSIKPTCVRCGCDDERLLEINHKNGGGRQEFLKQGNKLYWDIIMLRRTTDDLEILCRVCNAWHYLELKFNESLPFKVVWN